METAPVLHSRAHQIMDFVLQGLTNKQIAERLSLSPSFVSSVTNSPNFEHSLAIRRERMQRDLETKVVNKEIEESDQLKEGAKRAMARMIDLIDSSAENIARQAATDILDRAGPYKQSAGQQVNQSIVIIDEKSATLIDESLRLAGFTKGGEIIDTEPTQKAD